MALLSAKIFLFARKIVPFANPYLSRGSRNHGHLF
jgi:hypothetical protein